MEFYKIISRLFKGNICIGKIKISNYVSYQ